MEKKHINKRYLSLLLLTLLLSVPKSYASGYKLEFQSTSTLADAGDAAVVEDVGTNWYNSAGLVYLPQQLVYSAIAMHKPTNFGGTVFAPSLTVPGEFFFGNGGSSSYLNTILPAIHYGVPFSVCHECFAFGLSIVPAWGLLQDYANRSVSRYDLTRVYTRTLDIAPSIAWKINCQWSIGLGPDFHYWSLQLKNHVRTQPLTPTDSVSRVSSDAWGYGGHIGILYRPTETTRIGLNYRSQIFNNTKGFSHFTLTGITNFETNQFKLGLMMPPTTELSVYQDITPCWAVMGTIAYDQWSVIRDLHGRNFVVPPTAANPTGLTSVVIGTGYKNVFDFGLGTKYRLNEKLLARFSVKYESTPTSNQFRDITFPDGEKLGLNFGARYQIQKCLAVDLLYAHVFVRKVSINTVSFTGVRVDGHSRDTIDLFGAQLVWDI